MNKKILSAIKVASSIIGGLLGLGLYVLLNELLNVLGYGNFSDIVPVWANAMILIVMIIAFGIILYFISPKLTKWIVNLEKALKELPDKDLFMGAIGLVIGLIIAYLLSGLLNMIGVSWITVPLSITLYVILGYMGHSNFTK